MDSLFLNRFLYPAYVLEKTIILTGTIFCNQFGPSSYHHLIFFEPPIKSLFKLHHIFSLLFYTLSNTIKYFFCLSSLRSLQMIHIKDFKFHTSCRSNYLFNNCFHIKDIRDAHLHLQLKISLHFLIILYILRKCGLLHPFNSHFGYERDIFFHINVQ